MASAAEQLASSINFSAFSQSGRAEEAHLVHARCARDLSAGHVCAAAGHRPRSVPEFVPRQEPGRSRTLQHVRGRRRAAYGDLRAEHHAVYLGVHHRAAAYLRRAIARSNQEGRRAGPQSPQSVHALSHRHPCRLPGLWHRGWTRRAVRRRDRSPAGSSASRPC